MGQMFFHGTKSQRVFGSVQEVPKTSFWAHMFSEMGLKLTFDWSSRRVLTLFVLPNASIIWKRNSSTSKLFKNEIIFGGPHLCGFWRSILMLLDEHISWFEKTFSETSIWRCNIHVLSIKNITTNFSSNIDYYWYIYSWLKKFSSKNKKKYRKKNGT